MADYSHKLYNGADYSLSPNYSSGLDKKYGSDQSLSPYIGFKLPMSAFSVTTDPRTANQIDAVSKKISTGAKGIEITGIDSNVLEYMPKQHMKEISRLKKLAKVDLTFHGPLVEPTGVGRGNWDPQQREFAETQMWSALQRAHDLGPSTIVTFHSSNGLPETETRIKDKDGKEKLVNIAVVNERSGQFGVLPKTGKNYWEGDKEYKPEDDLNFINQQNWSQKISQISFEAQRAQQGVALAFERVEGNIRKIVSEPDEEMENKWKDTVLTAYNAARHNPQEYEKFLKSFNNDKERALITASISDLAYGDTYARDAYINLKDVFNQAYESAERDKKSINKQAQEKATLTLQQLDSFKEKMKKTLTDADKNPRKLDEFTQEINRGLRLLQDVGVPRTFRPLKEFALEKASDTFSNLAFKSYKEYESKDGSAPIISIENPPVGMGLTRGSEIQELVKLSRDKAAEKLQTEGLSKKEAEKAAERLIGVTWDVGHINMLKKYGFNDKDILKETDAVKKMVKHIHLSDNFGLEHTELPMGMGNVPIAGHEKMLQEAIGDDKFKKIKQVVETGGWYQHFKYTPMGETFEAFGSPLYGMKSPSYWNVTRGAGAGYFSGYGRMLPDVNFATYGAGFSNLPPELGGQMSGRSRLSGTPTE